MLPLDRTGPKGRKFLAWWEGGTFLMHGLEETGDLPGLLGDGKDEG